MTAMPIVATPPSTTAGTAPMSAAAMPDSNAPSSFDPEMNTISTAFTRPRSSSGVASATVIERMFMLNMSANPATASAAHESQNDFDSPKTMWDAPKIATTMNSVRPALPRIGRWARMMPATRAPTAGEAAEDAEAQRPDVEDARREQRQQRHGAAEEHREEVEADRAEQHRRAADEPGAREERLAAHRLRKPLLRPFRHTEHVDERRDEEHRRDGVDDLAAPRGEEQPADGGADDGRALKRDSAKGHRAREQVRRHERRRQRPRGGPAEGGSAPGGQRKHQERPERGRASEGDDEQAQSDENVDGDGGAVHESPWQPVGDVAGREGEQRQGQELGKADQAKVERALVDGVDLPADRDRHHLACEARREDRRPVEREVALPEGPVAAVAVSLAQPTPSYSGDFYIGGRAMALGDVRYYPNLRLGRGSSG